MDITTWLDGLGLSQYAGAFQGNAIAADVLPTLTTDDLRELGVGPLGDRKRILAAAAALANPPLLADVDAGRREVTIVFCDIVGFTDLNQRLGPEETHNLLNRFFSTVDALVQEYGGTIDKHIGDNVMALFGAPHAHTDDPERAGQLAIALHDAMAPLSDEIGHQIQVHIGIASGPVIASGTGSAAHREYTVTGTAVNVASRLLEIAGPGETLISQPVSDALPPRIVREPLGEVSLRGIAAAQLVWRIVGLSDRDTVGSDQPAFVGRKSELAQFAGIAGACRGDGTGRVVFVRGEPGIGKTRLVSQFLDIADNHDFACHRALVLDFGVGRGRDAIRVLVRSLLGVADDASDSDRLAAAARAVDEGWVESDDRMFLINLLDAPMPADLRTVYEAMDNDARTAGRRAALAHLAAGLATGKPVAMAVEDIHWAGLPELESLADVAAALSSFSGLLILTSRVDGDPFDRGWRDKLRGLSLITMDLAALRGAETHALAANLGSDADTPFARRCIERAEGNPLFLEQLLRGGDAAGADDLPGSLRSVVLARVDGLPPVDKAALQAASVMGQVFSLVALRYLLDQPEYSPKRLFDLGLVRTHGADLLFSHALIRDGVYSSLLKSRLRQLHLRAADWYAGRDGVLHAEHLDRAGDPAAPGAYLSASRAHAAEFRFGRALQLVDGGLPLAFEPEQIAVMSCLRGDLLRELGALEQSITTFRDAAANAPDDACRCYAWLGLAEGLRFVDAHQEAMDILAKAQPFAERGGHSNLLARIHFLRGNLCFPMGDLDGCRTEHGKALHYARAIGSPQAEANALGGLGDAAYFRAHFTTAQHHYDDCVALARSHGLVRIEVANLAMLAYSKFFQLKTAEAVDDAMRAAESAARIGDLRAQCLAWNVLCAIHAEQDVFDVAERSCQRSIDLADTIGSPRFRSDNLGHLSMVQYWRGDTETSLRTSVAAVAAAREFGVTYALPWILAASALQQIDVSEKRRLIGAAQGYLGPSSPSHTHLYFHTIAISVFLSLGEWDIATQHAGALREFTADEPFPWADLHIASGFALAAHGAGDRQPSLLQEIAKLRDIADGASLARIRAPLQAALEA